MVKRILLIIVLFFSFVVISFAQEKIKNKERLIIKANERYKEYSFSPAIDIYKRIIEKGYVNADVLKKLGNSYYFNADYQAAADTYKKLVTEYAAEVGPEYYFRYAQTLKTLGEYDASNEMMVSFTEKASADTRANVYEKEKDYLAEIAKNSGRYNLKPFEYNSIYSEFAPSFYKEGLLFSSDRDTGNLARYRHTWNSKDFLDLYKVNTNSTSGDNVVKFGEKNIINTRLHESTSVSTKDGNTIYFTRNNIVDRKYVKDDQGVIRLKIFKAILVDGLIDSIQELPFNSDKYSVANPALSPDEETLYFASDMPGTLGESDIFKVKINNDDTYGTPENLGNNINTAARETFPFVSSKGILYFSSDGHVGLGGLDIFATKITYNDYTGLVTNIGEPINSKMDDFTFIFNENERTGYFASNRKEGLGEDDIYSFIETSPLALECKQYISGLVRDKISNEVLVGVTIKVINESNQEISNAITDSNGSYSIEIDCNKGNFVRATTEGYVPSEEYLNKSDGKPIQIDFYLERDTVTAGFGDDLSKLLQLSTIYFDLNKYNVRKDAEIEIQKVIAAMDKYSSLKIKVNSHTDSRGKDAYNLWLSQKRAESTVKYMVSKGISKDRLIGEGFGETKLVNKCGNTSKCSSKEHDLNRRSEFIILE